MDGSLICATAFEKLLDIKYHIIIGRKEKTVDLTVSVEAVEFHRLVGLHKLHDLRLARANRENVFYRILSGDITLDDIKNSRYFCSIQKRLKPFSKIESLFDQNIFPKEEKDYTKGQTVYTLLKKEKIHIQSDIVKTQYDRLSPKVKD